MLRSIKSGQRKVRILALKIGASGLIASVSGPDSKKIKPKNEGTPVAGEFVMDIPIAGNNAEVVIIHDKSSVGTVSLGSTSTTNKELTVAASGGDFSCEVLIIGSDTAEKY